MVKLSIIWFLSFVILAATHVHRRGRHAGFTKEKQFELDSMEDSGILMKPHFAPNQGFHSLNKRKNQANPMDPMFPETNEFQQMDSIEDGVQPITPSFGEKERFPAMNVMGNPGYSGSPMDPMQEFPQADSMEDLVNSLNPEFTGNAGNLEKPTFPPKQQFKPNDIMVLKQKMSTPVIGPPKKCMCGIGNNPNERIVGGEIASPNEFPWQVGFRITPDEGGKPGAVFCGGTIINDRFILTAGHCLDKRRTKDIELLVGEHDYEKAENSNAFIVKLEKLILHPRYQSDGYHNDIALAKLATTIPFTTITLPPCFPRPGVDYTGKIAVVSGWGRVGEDEALSNILRKLEVPVISLTECRKLFEGDFFLYDGVLCAYHKEGGRDACSGDSGGPLVWKNKERWYLIGVVSWGEGCAREGVPAAYTRVDRYYRWIRSQTEGAIGCTD